MDRCVKGNESCGVDRHTPQEAYCLCATVNSETSDSLVHINLGYSCLLKSNTNRAQTQQSKANLMTRCGCDVVQVSLIRTFSAQIILAVSPWKHWGPEGAHLDRAVDRECWLLGTSVTFNLGMWMLSVLQIYFHYGTVIVDYHRMSYIKSNKWLINTLSIGICRCVSTYLNTVFCCCAALVQLRVS